MKTLEYIGPKQDGERHLKDQTGIEWMPGDVHAVQDQHAAEFLKHPTSWREVEGKPAALAEAGAPAAIPEWAKKAMELGATDEQIQAIAAAGGPETEAGAAAWMDATGAAFAEPAAAPAPAKHKGGRARKAS